MRATFIVALVAVQAAFTEAQQQARTRYSIRPVDAKNIFDDDETAEVADEASSYRSRRPSGPSSFRRPSRRGGRGERRQRPQRGGASTRPTRAESTRPTREEITEGAALTEEDKPETPEPTGSIKTEDYVPTEGPEGLDGPAGPDADVIIAVPFDEADQEAVPGYVAPDPEKADWYTENMQYTPPMITYEAAPLKRAKYAVCDFKISTVGTDEAGSITLTQNQFKPISASIELNGMLPEIEYELRVRQYGYLNSNCLGSGDEYNPLKEVDRYQQTNPYQDPSRGRLDNVTSDVDGNTAYTQAAFEGNLGGKESIMGRSIHITPRDGAIPVACCTIGIEKDPQATKAKKAHKPSVTAAYNPNPGYGFYQAPTAKVSAYGQIPTNRGQSRSYDSRRRGGGYGGRGQGQTRPNSRRHGW